MEDFRLILKHGLESITICNLFLYLKLLSQTFHVLQKYLILRFTLVKNWICSFQLWILIVITTSSLLEDQWLTVKECQIRLIRPWLYLLYLVALRFDLSFPRIYHLTWGFLIKRFEIIWRLIFRNLQNQYVLLFLASSTCSGILIDLLWWTPIRKCLWIR